MKSVIAYIAMFITLLLHINLCYGQSDNDSIEQAMEKLAEDERLIALIDLAYEYFGNGDLNKAQEAANEALILSDNINNYKEKANAFTILSYIARNKGALQSAISNAEKALDIGEQNNNATIKANAYRSLGYSYFQKSEFQKAFKNFENSLNNFKQLEDKNNDAEILYMIGVIYKNWSEYNDAIKYYEQALDIYKQLNSDQGMALIYSNLGNIYFYSGIDYENALINYEKALNIFQKLGNRLHEANALLNIGLVLEKRELYKDAMRKYNEVQEIAEEIDNDYFKAQALSNKGNINIINNNFDEALNQLNESLDILETLERQKDIALILKDIGKLYHLSGNNQQAKNYYLKSIAICQKLNLLKELSDNYKELANTLSNLGEYKDAFEYHKLYAQQNDSIFSTEYNNLMTEWNARLETAEKEAALIEQENEIKQQEAALKRKNIIVYAAISVIFIVVIFSLLLYKQFREKKKANVLLQEQNEEIKSQRDKIFEQNKEITDSIEYASKIQSAILPPQEVISNAIPEHFILNRPRDIVSGDFYWLNHFQDKVYLCAADCTGHGVPGAFMSMLGIALLNEIINKKAEYNAADILNNLRSQVVKSLHQRGFEGEAQDGMDIAFCIIDNKAKVIQFAGAFNPLIMIRNNELIEYKGDKMPIGVHIKQDTPFANHIIKYQENDLIYIFSDGYSDQFGGPKRKKFMIKRFRELLIKNHNLSMAEQKTALENNINEWMGHYDQIDDILVFGAKLS